MTMKTCNRDIKHNQQIQSFLFSKVLTCHTNVSPNCWSPLSAETMHATAMWGAGNSAGVGSVHDQESTHI